MLFLLVIVWWLFSDSLVAVETLFGWIVSGSQESSPLSSHNPVCHQLLNLSDIPEAFRSFWNLESIGTCPESELVDPVLERFEQSVKYANNRYEVTLPWKPGLFSSRLLNNEKLARARLASLSRKMSKEPELKCRYDEALRDLG